MTLPQDHPRVLIAEDETELRGLLVLLFQAEGFDVLEADDGQKAMDLFVAHGDDINIIITDLGLPRLEGVEMITRIRARSRKVRIIAATGYGQEHVRESVLKAGADDFLPKPFPASEIVARAKQLLGKR
jgi:two-component system, OmpR family, response regulator QseB